MANELFTGAQTIVYAHKEDKGYGATGIFNTGNYAMLTISETFTPQEEREVRPDRSGSVDHKERYIGRKSAEWEITRLLLPSGSAVTPPDDHALWENAFGNYSAGATSIEYLLATGNSTGLLIRRGIRAGGTGGMADYQEHIRGAIANRWELTFGNQGNNGLAQVTFGGRGKQWGHTGNSTTNTPSYSSVAEGHAITLDNVKQFSAGSLVMFGADARVSGIFIDSVNYTNSTVTFKQTASGVIPDGTVVKPYNPTESTSGSPIHARLGFVSLDGSSTLIDCLGGRITLEDGRDLLNEEVGYDSPSRVIRTDRRNVTFSLDFLVKKDEVGELLGSMSYGVSSENIQINVGAGANKTCKIHMKNAVWDMVPTDVPDQDMMRISMAGRALGVNNNDSLKVRFL